MSIRITTAAAFNSGLANLQSRQQSMSEAQVQLTSGKRVLRPSDDPSAAARAGEAPGRVFVLGRVGWEAKFTIAALEEAGWEVDARLRLADTLFVTQGASRTPVPGMHAAVVALDTVLGAAAAQLTRFVRAGGCA